MGLESCLERVERCMGKINLGVGKPSPKFTKLISPPNIPPVQDFREFDNFSSVEVN